MKQTITRAEFAGLMEAEADRPRRTKFGNRAAFRCLACGASVRERKAPCPACQSSAVQRFDSHAEARRYDVLRQLSRAKEVSEIRLQPVYTLEVNGVKVATYRADFSYKDAHGREVVEDVKGGKATQTPEFRIKAALMLACHGIRVRIIA